MSTKKEPSITTLRSLDYLSASFIRSLIFDHPKTLIDNLKQFKNPLEMVLSAYELIANRILGQKPKSESKKFAAEQVLIQAEKIRKAIRGEVHDNRTQTEKNQIAWPF